MAGSEYLATHIIPTGRITGICVLAPKHFAPNRRYPLHPSNDPLMASGALDDSAASSSLPSTTGTASPQLSRTTTVRWVRTSTSPASCQHPYSSTTVGTLQHAYHNPHHAEPLQLPLTHPHP